MLIKKEGVVVNFSQGVKKEGMLINHELNNYDQSYNGLIP
jgi:hypothetical protein